MLKIGVIAIGYNCHENLNAILASWVAAKCGVRDDNGDIVQKPLEDAEFKICAVSALFNEYAELGHKPDNEPTKSVLNAYQQSRGIDEAIFVNGKTILDFESRNLALEHLKQFDLDYIWQLDLSDEYYTIEEIKQVINYLKTNDLYDFYRINFKNFFGKMGSNSYLMNFNPVRIINARRNGGIKRFYFDNDVEFNNGIQTPYCGGITIPTTRCNPRHLSWVGSKEFLTRKIQYQHKAIGTCSYRYNETEDCLKLSEKYYQNNFPEIFYEK